jgi:hypothetical protein
MYKRKSPEGQDSGSADCIDLALRIRVETSSNRYKLGSGNIICALLYFRFLTPVDATKFHDVPVVMYKGRQKET